VELIDGALTVTREQQGFNRADLAQSVDDGHRHALIDGALVVTTARS